MSASNKKRLRLRKLANIINTRLVFRHCIRITDEMQTDEKDHGVILLNAHSGFRIDPLSLKLKSTP